MSRSLSPLSTALFLVVLASLFLPWMSIVKGWPFALSGLSIVMGKFNIPPTEHYAMAATGSALAGAILPNVVPRRRTWLRVLFSALGILAMGLMVLHVSPQFGGTAPELRLGFYVPTAAFAVLMLLNVAAIAGDVQIKQAEISQKAPEEPWKKA